MEVLGLWNLDDFIEWFPSVMIEITKNQISLAFPFSDPRGPGTVVLVDKKGLGLYYLDPSFWDLVAGILHENLSTGLPTPDLKRKFQAALAALKEIQS